MGYLLPQESIELCFDKLTASVRPCWEEGPSMNFYQKQSLTYHEKSPPKTAIHAHIYYQDDLPEILKYTKNVHNRHYLINTDKAWKARIIEQYMRKKGESEYEIKVLPNRGRDISALFVGWHKRLADFALLVHCHTKRTPHAPKGFGDAWLKCLLECTFPHERDCNMFQKALMKKNAGFIMPWPHKFVAHNVNWGQNFDQTRDLMKLMGHNIRRDTFLAYPAGSFFWAQVKSLQPLFNLELRWSDFADEPLPGDGRLAHALERCIGLIPTLNNKDNYVYWAGRKKQEVDGPEQPTMIQIPVFNQTNQHSKDLFNLGLQTAMIEGGVPEKSIRFGRRIPTEHHSKENMGISCLIAGTQKGGTTALADYLRKHPSVFVPERKELHFFDNEQEDWNKPDYERLHQYYTAANKEQLWCEATPITMYWEPCAQRIWNYNPEMRIIISLRNPIDRAYSHWAMEKSRQKERLTFEQAIEKEEERARTALPQQDRIYSYLDRGYYSSQIKRLWRWFGRKQVLILKQEDLIKNPKNTLNKICSFLDVARYENIDTITSNQGQYNSQLPDSMRQQLLKMYSGEITTLENMLNWDLNEWRKGGYK